MRTILERKAQAYRAAAVSAAMVFAGLLVVAMPHRAEATFPGENGRIAFASDRTTGEGVDNPTGDFEIFTMERDGTGLVQLTNNFAPGIYTMNADGSKPKKT